MEQCKTGIKGFDELVGGGIPLGKQVLITGSPGTGKTIFCLEYIYNGAKKFNEKGLFVTFEETSNDVKSQAEQFGWNFDKLEDKVTIMSVPASEITESTLGEIMRFIKSNNIKRVVFDSLTALAINTPSARIEVGNITDLFIKRFIYQFIYQLRTMEKVNTLLISQTTKEDISLDGVSEFVCDGIIKIDYETMGGDFSRALSIRKMRQVKNDEDIHPLEISEKGLIIHTLD